MTAHNSPNAPVDPELSIGATTQTARRKSPGVGLSKIPTSKERQRFAPRKLLPFDLIKGLQDMAWDKLGDRFAFEHCAVQRDRDGHILAEFDPNAMRLIENRVDQTYGQLVRYAIEEAERLSLRLAEWSPDMRFRLLGGYVKGAQTDGQLAWVLSAACLRRMIFPGSYAKKRTDCVRYRYDPKDGACGKSLSLKALTPAGAKLYLSHARLACPTLPLDRIKPITSEADIGGAEE